MKSRSQPPRVAIGVLKQETATFSPSISVASDFTRAAGSELDRILSGTETEYGGAVTVLRAANVEIVPLEGAWALSGGPIADNDLDTMIDGIVESLAQVLPVDGIIMVLHGAMASPTNFDPEGSLLKRLRNTAPDCPLVATIDLHAVLTSVMLEHSDALHPYHTYPHTDQFQTGQRAARSLLRLIDGTRHTHVGRFALPMLARGDELLTATGLLGHAINRCRQLEDEPEVLSAGVLIGNPYTDVPELACNVFVTTTGTDRFDQVAVEVGDYLWSRRTALRTDLTPLPEALEVAQSFPGLVVLSDGADATSAGAPGDSNAILRALLDSRYGRRALVPIVDKAAAQSAWALGPGARGHFRLGGSVDSKRHEPLVLEATVEHLSDGAFSYEDGTPGRAGRTAILKCGAITVMVTEHPVWVVGRNVFAQNGANPLDFDLVVVKSPNGYRTHYAAHAAAMLAVDAPGCTTADLRRLPYRRVRRPLWPLDPETPDPTWIPDK